MSSAQVANRLRALKLKRTSLEHMALPIARLSADFGDLLVMHLHIVLDCHQAAVVLLLEQLPNNVVLYICAFESLLVEPTRLLQWVLSLSAILPGAGHVLATLLLQDRIPRGV